jgi:hypothetical protein
MTWCGTAPAPITDRRDDRSVVMSTRISIGRAAQTAYPHCRQQAEAAIATTRSSGTWRSSRNDARNGNPHTIGGQKRAFSTA